MRDYELKMLKEGYERAKKEAEREARRKKRAAAKALNC
jgi:hypothetical protein